MNRIKSIIFSALLIIAALPALAAPDARFRYLLMEYTLHADGSQEEHIRKEVEINSHVAMNNTYGESFIVYNPDYQTLDIRESYTRQSDGTIIQTPANAFVKQLPAAAVNAPYYNNIVEMAVVHTGLDIGCTLYLDYTLTTKAGYLKELDVAHLFTEPAPTARCDIRITVPSSKKLQVDCGKRFPDYQVKQEQGNSVYTWSLSHVPANLRENYAPVEYYLLASTFANKAEAAAALGNQIQPLSAACPEVKALREAVQKSNSDKEKIAAICQFVDRRVDNSSLLLKEAGYRIRPCEEVVKSAYGTATEKGALLYSLFKEAGIPAELGFCSAIHSNQPIENGYLNRINEVVVWVKEGEKNRCLRASNTAQSMESYMNLTGVSSLTYPASATLASSAVPAVNAREEVIEVVLNKDGVCTTASGSAQLQSVNGSYQTLTLALNNEDIPLLNSKRVAPALLPTAMHKQLHYTVKLPQGVKLCNKEKDIQMKNAAGQLSIVLKKTADGFEVTRSLDIAQTYFTPAQYPALYTLLTTWGDAALGKMLLAVEH